jgi:O-antigen/teichoic acid export membrane protein
MYAMLPSAIWFYMARSGAALVGLLPAVCLFFWWKQPAHPLFESTFAYREYFQHSKYSSISMLSSYAQGQVDTLAVAHFLTPLGAATYGAAKIFYTGITMVTTGLTMVVLPTASRITVSGEGGLGRLYGRALFLAYALLLPSVVVLAVFAHPLLHLIFGGRYADAAPTVRIFCLAALVLPVSSVTDSVANGAGWWRQACVAAITGGVIGITASLFLTRAIGLSGAALSPILAISGSAIVIAFLTWGRLRTGGDTLRAKPHCIAGLAGESQ